MSVFLSKQINKSVPTGKYYRSLMKNMLIIGFFLPFLPMILVCGIIYWQFHSAYQKNVQIQIKEAVISSQKNIDNYLKERIGNLLSVAESFNLEESRSTNSLEMIHRKLQRYYGDVFTNLGLVNGQGLQIAYTGPDNAYLQNDSRIKLLNGGGRILSLTPDRQGEVHLIVAVRIIRHEKTWTLWSSINRRSFGRVVDDSGIGSFIILDKDVKNAIRAIGVSGKAKSPTVDFSDISKIIPDDFEPDNIAVIEPSNNSGEKSIWGATLLSNNDWVLLYKREAKEAFADLKTTRKVILVTIFTAGFLIAANAFRLSKKTVYSIRQADKKKQKMNENMFQTGKLASIGELAAGIAHEINNPVAVMIEEAGWIYDLLDEEEFHESKNLSEFKRALNQIRTQGRRCKDITRKLLSFARKTDFGINKIRLHELIEDIVAITGKRAEYNHVVITTDVRKDLPELYVPETELQQVILNLINNALDSMEETGGVLSLSARMTEGGIMIDVSDNGPGIAQENLLRIFDPFFTTKPVGKGTGLGLSICYGIVRKMGGEITVDSSKAKGTAFHIKIPLPPRAPSNSALPGIQDSTATT